jgi:predicted phosphoribosyltransferase
VGIAPEQAGCTKGMTNAAAVAVLRRAGCQSVLRATYVDSTRSARRLSGAASSSTVAGSE